VLLELARQYADIIQAMAAVLALRTSYAGILRRLFCLFMGCEAVQNVHQLL
jgi:hypothetical protein